MVIRVDVPANLIGGDVDEGYGKVADAFRRNFRDRDEVGAACAVYREDARSPSRSHIRGACSRWTSPVARYWPEFAANGKGSITVRQLLSHQAGLAVPDQRLDLDTVADLDQLAVILARQPVRLLVSMLNPRGTLSRAMRLLPELMDPGAFNRREVLAVELPSVNGTGEVRGIARVYGSLAPGGRYEPSRVPQPGGSAGGVPAERLLRGDRRATPDHVMWRAVRPSVRSWAAAASAEADRALRRGAGGRRVRLT